MKLNGKKTLVLDLDETLIHADRHQKVDNPEIVPDFEICVRQVYTTYINIRPGVEEFLKEMDKCYNVIIFTASIIEYAYKIMNVIDPNKICRKIYWRRDCTKYNGQYVKDLKDLKIDLKDVIIIDNMPASY